MKDFNGIVSQEVEKTMPNINKKTDFLHPVTNTHKTLDFDMMNNGKILMNLQEELEKLMKRKEQITQRNYLIELKGEINDKKEEIRAIMQEIRFFELEIEKNGKKLNIIENFCDGVPESVIKCVKIEEELGLSELKLKNTILKSNEIKKFTEENAKKEEKIQILFEETMKKAMEIGIDDEKEILVKKYRDLKKKKGYLEKDIEFLMKRNDKMVDVWLKELEEITKIIENRIKKTENLEEGVKKEKEIITEMQEKAEFSEEIFRKIEELTEFSGIGWPEGVLKKFEAKNMSFTEETKKKLVVNSSFISNKDENEEFNEKVKKKVANPKGLTRENVDKTKVFEGIKKEEFVKKKEKIVEIKEDVKKSFNFNKGNGLFEIGGKKDDISNKEELNLNEIIEEKSKEIPFKIFNFSKKKENNDDLINSIEKEPLKEALIENNIKETLKTFNFSKKDVPIQINTKENPIQANTPIPNKPIQIKRPRNIFNSTENEEKNSENVGKIIEIPEIQEKRDFIKENPVFMQENPVFLGKEEEKMIKPFKKKIQDPYEIKKEEEEIDFERKNEEKKTMGVNIKKEALNKPNFDNNNDFFEDFDFD